METSLERRTSKGLLDPVCPAPSSASRLILVAVCDTLKLPTQSPFVKGPVLVGVMLTGAPPVDLITISSRYHPSVAFAIASTVSNRNRSRMVEPANCVSGTELETQSPLVELVRPPSPSLTATVRKV